MLALQLLGPPQVTLDNHVLSIPRRKSRALLFYLAANSAPVLRDQILALLWPDHDRAAAQQVLRTTVYGLRKHLGDALVTTDDSLALAPDTLVDLRRFEQQIVVTNGTGEATEPLAAAMALYRGEFLAGFSVPDAEEFEQWLIGLRERCVQLALRGYSLLAMRYEVQRDFAAARDALARAIELNPLQEDLQRAAMRVDFFAGDRAGAIRRYEHLRRLLDDELGVPPLEETRALYDAIITDTMAPVAPSAPAPAATPAAPPQRPQPAGLPFTGRTSELEKLGTLASTHRLGLIEGDTGIGKTRLAEEFLHDFQGLVLVGHAHELEQALPYQPVIEALRELIRHPQWPQFQAEAALAQVWRAELARLLPELHDGSAPAPADARLAGNNESRLWEAVSQLLLGLARGRALALLFDDLHWADASTLALLGYLVRQPTHAAITFLATTRPIAPRTQLATLVQTLTREGRLLRLPLGRLAERETLELAQHFSPRFAYPLAEWLTRNADGSPYILAELLRYASDNRLLLPDGTLNLSLLSSSPVVPGTVYSLLQARLAGLSVAARRVVDIAVVVGSEFALDLVAQAAGLPEPAVLDALDELLANRIVLPQEGLRYRFDHPLTMEVAYREVGEARHRALHRAVAEALERQHNNEIDSYAGLIASHFAEGNAPERAAHYARLAGHRAAALSAWAEAIAFYQQALAGADEPSRLEILLALGTAYLNSGAPAQATDELRAAIALAERRKECQVADQARLHLTNALIAQARFAEAIATARQVLEHGEASNSISAALGWATALSVEGTDLAGAAQRLRNLLDNPPVPPTREQLAHIHFELGSIAAQQGDLDEAISRYHTSLALAEQDPPEMLQYILSLNNLAYHMLLNGDTSGAPYAEHGLALVREYGMINFQPYLHSTLGEIALERHDLDEAERQFNEGLELADRLNVHERIAGLNANLGLLAIARGQPTRAIHRLSTAQAQADALGTNHLAAQIRIWLAPLLQPDEAREALAEARAIAESGGRKHLLIDIDELEAQLPPAA